MIKKVSLLMLISLLTLNISNHAVTLPSPNKQHLIDSIRSFEDVLELKNNNLNLVTKDIQALQIEWNNMLETVRNYVNQNASKYSDKFNKLKKISDILFGKLASNYTTNVAGKKLFNLPAMHMIFGVDPSIFKLQSQAKSLYDDLSKNVKIAFQKTKDVRSVLAQLARTLQDICTKIDEDFSKPLEYHELPRPFDKYNDSNIWGALELDMNSIIAAKLDAASISYMVLGVEPAASPMDIKKGYHIKSLQWHPDKNPGNLIATQVFQLIKEAHEYLKSQGMAH